MSAKRHDKLEGRTRDVLAIIKSRSMGGSASLAKPSGNKGNKKNSLYFERGGKRCQPPAKWQSLNPRLKAAV